MTDTQPLAEVKAHLSAYVDRVEREHDRVLITRNGRPAAMLVSPEDLDALEATIELLSDPEAMRALAEAEADVAAGRVVDADELRRRFR
jgi:antitoxin YefM